MVSNMTRSVAALRFFESCLPLLLFLITSSGLVQGQNLEFVYDGFRSADLALDFASRYTSNGVLMLTSALSRRVVGRAFYPEPVTFKNSYNGTVFSFSTTFVFAIIPEYPKLGGHGMTFVLAPERGVPWAFPSQYLCLFNAENIGNETNHIFAIEIDTVQDFEFDDMDDNHVGVDFNGLVSNSSVTAGYYNPAGGFAKLSLKSGQAMHINVTLAPRGTRKPGTPLLSRFLDLSPIIKEKMYVGFSASTGLLVSTHCISGWSFRINGQATELSLSSLPQISRSIIPSATVKPKPKGKLLTIGIPVISVCFLSVVAVYFRRKRKFSEVVEDWELDYGPHRFKYKDLYIATKGFSDRELLGSGGFGKVYKGILPTSKIEIAVKRVSHESRQGIREFVAEVVSIGRLRHRNLVTLLGYCRRKRELLLVYEHMPNGSLNKLLYNQQKLSLNWSQRMHIMKGVASGLLYLHEEWERVIIHRDIKPSNILLDANLNGRLGDFGLARLHDHGAEPLTTNVAGTLGYLAPEHVRTGKATKSTDVYAFGVFLIEVASGRRPIETRQSEEEVPLIVWVLSCWSRGEILNARDPKLGLEFVAEEVELVLKLGLLCLNSEPRARPSMRQVVQYLEGDLSLQVLSSALELSASGLVFGYDEDFDNPLMSSLPKEEEEFCVSSRVMDSLLSGGR